ncbi:Tn3 family transposase [Streptomyces sp. enrichment culture]|uniref:Tn3 family transposase n=1 Tax=Streptomyces sp. enrichment culture TaxID=1795815 RepID=UPI003F56C4D2
MEIDRQYTDTHGAAIVGFALAHMLGCNLLPRLKNVGSARLYRPSAGEDQKWPNSAPVLSTKTIDRDLIRQPYDQIVKYHHLPAPGHRRGGAGRAPLHPRRTQAPHLRDRETRAGGAYGVHR